MKVVDISWVTDGEDVLLPEEVEVPERFLNGDYNNEELVEVISDWLSDEFGFMHYSFAVEF